MREAKYDSLLNVSIVILIVSTIMLGITGYNIFFKKDGTKAGTFAALPPKKEAIRDSLRQVYNSTIRNLDNNPQITGSDITDKNAQASLGEMGTLRNEIDSLLRQHGSESDLATAKVKIEELQRRVAELENRYTNAETENKRLQALINRLIVSDKAAAPLVFTPAPANPGNITPAPERATPASASSVVAGLHLFAVTVNRSNEEETASSDEAEKIVGSFLLKNNAARAGGEVVVVVLQPDGKVIKNSVWESGTFETREGKKVYSRKIYFDASGDEKQLNFSLIPDKFLKGDYTMQIWYNGSMVGKMVRTLS